MYTRHVFCLRVSLPRGHILACDRMDWLMFAHHVVTIIAMAFAIFTGRHAGPILMVLWLAGQWHGVTGILFVVLVDGANPWLS